MKVKKIKFTFLIFTGLIILSFAIFSYAQEAASADKNVFQDSDQDGLSNEEEAVYGTNPNNPDTDGDGYSDGVEVKSGYDPLKPAPGDKIVAETKTADTTPAENTVQNTGSDQNLTEELSTKVTALINQSDTDNSGIKVEDLDGIIQETTAQQLTFSDLPKVDESSIKIKKQNYSKLSEEEKLAKEKDDTSQYLTAIGYVLSTNSPQPVENQDDIQNIFNEMLNNMGDFSKNTGAIPEYFIGLADKGKLMLEQMKDIEVPESMLNFHIKGLQLANYAISLKDEATKQTDDPVAMIVLMSKVNNLMNLTTSLFNEMSSELTSIGIKVNT